MPRLNRRSFALRVASLAAVVLLGNSGCAPTPPALPISGAPRAAASRSDAVSLYDLESRWTDQTGATRPLAALRGRPRAVAMIYTRCTATCPLALGEMRRIAAATDIGVGLVLVTLDPARDTPGVLAAYAREHGLDASRWTLLAGTDGDVRELAAAIGVRYRALGTDAIAHSNVITLLDADGVVVHQQAGFDGTAEAIRIARALTD